MEVLQLLSDIPTWSVAVVGILTTLYIYLTWHFGYWEKQGVKCDKPWPLIGNDGYLFKKPLEETDTEMYKKYGRVWGLYEGGKPALMVADPEMLKTILVKDFNTFRNRRIFETRDNVIRKFMNILRDDEWKNLRNIITPTFTTGKIKQMISLMNECGETLVNHLKRFAENDGHFEAKRCLSSYTMDVIATCAFGTKIDSLNDPDSDFIKHAKKMFSKPSPFLALIFLFPKLGKYLPLPIPRESINYFTNLIENVMSARKKEKSTRADFLQLLIEAQLESEKGNGDDVNENIEEVKGKSNFLMTRYHVIAQAMLFLLAGYETSSTTLTLTLYNLMMNEEVQEKLINEIDEVLKKHKGSVTYDAVSEMQYMDMIISETLRLFPPVVRLERECQEDDYNLHGIKLKKGCNIGIPAYTIHHDEEFYPNPEVFDPERFSPENRKDLNPYTYLPFGQGLRNCIGMRFANIEMKVALAAIFKTFRVKKCEATEIPFKRSMEIAMFQPQSVNLKVEIRTDK